MRPILDISRAKVLVELTNRCNLRCAMCPMTRSVRPPTGMSWPLVEKVAGELADHGVTASWLFELGEPLMYPHIAEAVELFPGAAVSTNGMLLDRRMGERLLATSLGRIRICIDTVNPGVYPELRRGGSFERVRDNLRAFLELARDHEIVVEIQKMITRHTARETVADFVHAFDLDRHPRARVVEKTCEGLDTSAATDLHDAYHGCFQGDPFRYLVVLADGRVTHCCFDFDGTQSLGDLSRRSLDEILASPRLEAIRDAFRRRDFAGLPRCAECFQGATGTAVLKGRLIRIGRRLERVLPVTRLGRRIINR